MQITLVLGIFAATIAFGSGVPNQPNFKQAAPSYGGPSQYSKSTYAENKVDYSHPPYYKFEWAVKDDASYNDFGQSEARELDKTTGNYWVYLPDGRKQIVNYYVDGDSGYIADVKYEGVANYPAYNNQQTAYKPSYQKSGNNYNRASVPYIQTAYQPIYRG